MRVVIDQFMFSYQHSFAGSIRIAAERIFEDIGTGLVPSIFLVGVAWPGTDTRHSACVEPEDGPWPQALFAGISAELDAAFKSHPSQMMFYGDAPSMRDKPENIRRAVVTEGVSRALEAVSAAQGVKSFVSSARKVGDYYVAVVLQAEETLFTKFPPISYEDWSGEVREGSFILSCIYALFTEAERMLTLPEPGRFLRDGMRTSDEIIRQAAGSFMRIPFLPGQPNTADMFEEFNAISKLMYEGEKGRGRMILARPDDPDINYVVKLADPVPLRKTRWARKLLQMGRDDTSLVTGFEAISGLARPQNPNAPPYSVDFLDQQHWDFRRGSQILLRTRFGEAKLPQEAIGDDRFIDNFNRIFPHAGEGAAERFRVVLDQFLEQPHGSMLVVASDAQAEAARLERQGTRIEPVPLSTALIDRASRIDGSILADPGGLCHAIGVILDGPANDECTPSRGGRYNSAVRYVLNGSNGRLAFVISEDRTLDIIPLLRPRLSRAKLEEVIASLEGATTRNYHRPRNFLSGHRFYLDQGQCDRVNAALTRLNAAALNEGGIVLQSAPFAPDPGMNDEYLVA